MTAAKTDSPTPRTDAAEIDAGELHDQGHGPSGLVRTEFARDLERENNNLRAALNRARAWGIMSKNFSMNESDKLAKWVDSGMTDPLWPLPDYYAVEDQIK